MNKALSVLSKKSRLLQGLLIRTYLLLKRYDSRKRTIHPSDKNPDKTFYVIRPRKKEEGLLSCYFFVLDNVSYAIEKGYIPYVDFLLHVERLLLEKF